MKFTSLAIVISFIYAADSDNSQLTPLITKGEHLVETINELLARSTNYTADSMKGSSNS